jgi:phosphoglycerol transferase MdoB-like AlkP superfamily enzyme
MATQSLQLTDQPLKSGTILRKILSRIAPFLVLICLLIVISYSFGPLGGIDDYFRGILWDLPYLCLIFAALLYTMRPGFWRVLIAVTPFMILYVTIDIYYIFLNRVFKFDDLMLLPEGINVCPSWALALFFLCICTWITAFLFFLKRNLRQFVVPLLLFALAAGPPLAAFKAPKQFLRSTESLGISILPWSDRWTTALMGRTSSLLLFAASQKKAMDELALLPIVDDPDRDPALLEKTLREKRNIHIIVLESFLDPKQFKKLKFKTPPEPPQFEDVRKKMHVSLSPVFGGGTAQAEFEILCGVPAYTLYQSAEFNTFDGTSTPCLPNLLAATGYRTVATQSYKPDFFNSEIAYRSLGFKEINFPTIYAGVRKTYLKYDIPDNYIFDGDLFTQNLTYVEKLLAEGQPFLNYVLGVYGHWPHATDTSRFPPKVDIVGVDKKSLAYLAIQQFYYRAEAVADYLKKLRKLDPDGIILVTSDHLPALDLGTGTYENLGYGLVNSEGEFRKNIWIYDGPRPKNISWPNHYYEYMDFLLDILTKGGMCQQVVCKNRTAWSPQKLMISYNNIMVQGSGVSKKPAGLVAGAPPQPPTDGKETPVQQ